MARFSMALAAILVCAVYSSGSVSASDTSLIGAQASEHEVVVPAAISMSGNNDTQWESDFRFFNPCFENVEVSVEFQPEHTDNAGAELPSRSFTLTENTTLVFEDIFDLIPNLGNRKASGSLLVQSSSASGCSVMIVSRTFNDTPDGTLGLTVPAMPHEAPDEDFLDFPGLIHNDDFRTNLRLVNFSDGELWVALTAYDEDGVEIGDERIAKVFGRSTRQINDVAAWLGAGADLSPFTVRVAVNRREIQAVATVIDNLTGDSVLYTSSFADTSQQWLAGAASQSGKHESQWRTDLWLYNPTWSTIKGESEFFVDTAPDESYVFGWQDLPSLSTESYLDLVSDELGLEETRGYVVLTGDGGSSVPQVAARTYNLDPVAGTSGLNLRAFSSSDLLEPGQTGYLVGGSNSSNPQLGYRTNLGILNTESTWTQVRVTVLESDGSLAANPYETYLAPLKMHQFDVFKKLGLEDTDMIGSIRLDVISGGAVAVYATEIDNQSQDSILITAQRAVGGDGCNFVLDSVSSTIGPDGGSGSFAVATDSGCDWEVSSAQSWITISSGLSESGSSTVSYTVYPNSGSAREGTITAGHTIFKVSQQQRPDEISISLPGGVPMELVCIPSGTFHMGSPDGVRGRRENEVYHQVTLTTAYCIGANEVTQKQWNAVMGSDPVSGADAGDDYPVHSVSWDDIAGPDGFLDELNEHLEDTGQAGAWKFRLPTEAEWEMAARGGSQTRFSFGDGLECGDDSCGACTLYDQNMWWCGNSENHAEMVGTKLPNAFGIYDMHGNVAEWVLDAYDEHLGTDPATDPSHLPRGAMPRVVRGGSYEDAPADTRSAARSDQDQDSASRTTGFRIARSYDSPVEITDCGQIITTDAVLAADLGCDAGEDPVAIRVEASNISLDLGGHTLDCSERTIGVSIGHIAHVGVENGSIEGCLIGVDIAEARRVTVEDLAFNFPESVDPDEYIIGAKADSSEDVMVRGVVVDFVPVAHKEAIGFYNSTFTVDELEVYGGAVGVMANCLENAPGQGSNGSITDSSFEDVHITAVLIMCTSDLRIANNTFLRNEMSIAVESYIVGGNTGLVIEENSIYDSFRGIWFFGVSDSEIRNNIIRDGTTGIYLDKNYLCPKPPTPDCFYATRNVISGNDVTGHWRDLLHHPNALGNTWEDNTCRQKEGSEIPECHEP